MSYLVTAGSLLLDLVFGALTLLFVLRVALQVARAGFQDPLSQFVYRASNPVLAPLRRLLRPVGRFDVAAAAVAWLIQCLKVVALFALAGMAPAFAGVLVLGLAELAGLVLTLFFWIIIIAVVLSFLGSPHHPLVPLIDRLAAPWLRPFRRLLPPLGGIDLSPLLACVAILLARILLVAPLGDLGTRLATG
ncbi:MAG TPA: YggT family protein [Xanthomonadaceae bacterium]|nr:YggT family protein [Xanthomonadaceae bacterium]